MGGVAFAMALRETGVEVDQTLIQEFGGLLEGCHQVDKFRACPFVLHDGLTEQGTTCSRPTVAGNLGHGFRFEDEHPVAPVLAVWSTGMRIARVQQHNIAAGDMMMPPAGVVGFHAIIDDSEAVIVVAMPRKIVSDTDSTQQERIAKGGLSASVDRSFAPILRHERQLIALRPYTYVRFRMTIMCREAA